MRKLHWKQRQRYYFRILLAKKSVNTRKFSLISERYVFKFSFYDHCLIYTGAHHQSFFVFTEYLNIGRYSPELINIALRSPMEQHFRNLIYIFLSLTFSILCVLSFQFTYVMQYHTHKNIPTCIVENNTNSNTYVYKSSFKHEIHWKKKII